MKGKLLLALACTAFIFCSCGESGINIKKTITGKAGEIVIVVDKANWEAEPGAALRSVLATDYPMLPQKEPAFNLINIPKNSFSELFQSHRNLIVVDINGKQQKDTIEIKKDIWAAPQIAIYLRAKSSAGIAELVNRNSDLIFNAIDQAEKDRIIRNCKKYEESSLRKIVSEKFGGSPYFPNGYALRKQTDDFIWIAYETTYTNQVVLIYTIPYDGKHFPTVDSLVARQNDIMKRNVPGMLDNSYMTTATEAKPILKWFKYKGMEFAEMRGFWEVQNDFMGGPFVDHIFYAKEPGKLLVMEGFVYAPRYNKRNYLRQVEAILYSFEWAENFQNK